jgi:glyoxylase-like metal-dependent hydrolase (beta-lactamase superfamily II)
MEIIKVKNRSVVFRFFQNDEWYYNIHLILGKKSNFIIDTGLGSGSIAPVLEFLKEDPKPVILINTHYHWDHIWGNHLFLDNLIISHKLCREMIGTKWEEMLTRNGVCINGEAGLCLPNMVFEKELYLPEEGLRLFYTPGHTIDSISILDEEDKVLSAGDNIGDTMEEIVPSIYSNTDLFRESLQSLRGLDYDTVISGHNEVLGREVIDLILQKL